jgi:uncharacterized protein YqeY
MSLTEQITDDYKTAFKAKDELRVRVLRMLRAELKNKELDKNAALTDDEVLAVIRTAIKKRHEAAEAFLAGGAVARADEEKAESAILAAYLPPELDEAAIERLIAEAITETGARTPADLGKVMKALMPKVAGRADGKIVNQKVRQALTA